MRFSTATIVLAAAGLAAAQTSATSTSSAATATGTSSCAAQNILDACLSSTRAQLEACTPNDYGCLCDQYTNVLTCYGNCPGDPGKFGVEQQKTQNCNAAKAYGTTSTHATAKSSTTSATDTASASATDAATSGFASGSSSATRSGSASSSTPTGAAGRVVVSGGLLGAVAGVFGLLL